MAIESYADVLRLKKNTNDITHIAKEIKEVNPVFALMFTNKHVLALKPGNEYRMRMILAIVDYYVAITTQIHIDDYTKMKLVANIMIPFYQMRKGDWILTETAVFAELPPYDEAWYDDGEEQEIQEEPQEDDETQDDEEEPISNGLLDHFIKECYWWLWGSSYCDPEPIKIRAMIKRALGVYMNEAERNA